jgi:hypothetical protein
MCMAYGIFEVIFMFENAQLIKEAATNILGIWSIGVPQVPFLRKFHGTKKLVSMDETFVSPQCYNTSMRPL